MTPLHSATRCITIYQRHQRVIIHYTNATNTLTISHKHLITKYVTQNMPLSPHTHTPILVKLLTSPGSAARCTTHNIPLHQRVITHHSSPHNAFAISHKHPITKYVIQNMPLSPHTHTPNHASLLTPPHSPARYTTIYHCISGLSQTIVAPPIHS